MRLVKTPQGPRVALEPDVVLILANTTGNATIRQACFAWLDDYRLSRMRGVADLQARINAVEAFDSVLAASTHHTTGDTPC